MPETSIARGPAGFEAPLQLRLTSIAYSAADTNVYTFAPVDGRPLPKAEPGAHITLQLPTGLERQYSLVMAGATWDEYVIGVKRDAASRGGSSYIHDRLRVGAILPVLPPRNNFPLDEQVEHTVFVAGGIGVTPILSMARRLHARGRDFELHYSCRSRGDAAFLGEVRRLPNVRLHFDDEEGGRVLPVPEIVARAPAGAHLYCCGPAPMIAALEAACADRPPHTVHVEHFKPLSRAADQGAFTVRLARSAREIEVPPGKSILQAVRDLGVDVPSSCEAGVCGACETRVISGVPDHRDAILTEKERQSNTTMMICCSGSKTKELVLDL